MPNWKLISVVDVEMHSELTKKTFCFYCVAFTLFSSFPSKIVFDVVGIMRFWWSIVMNSKRSHTLLSFRDTSDTLLWASVIIIFLLAFLINSFSRRIVINWSVLLKINVSASFADYNRHVSCVCAEVKGARFTWFTRRLTLEFVG